MNNEFLYHASLSPFKTMLAKGIITTDECRVIDTMLQAKYSPIFVEKSYQISLDNKRH